MKDGDSGQQTDTLGERKSQIIAAGAILGAVLGLISSYLYTRAAEENGNVEAGAPGSVSTGQLLAVLLAILGLVRQIAELGKPKKDDKAGKK
jgi:formate-dependent nitrite reductase membrane component NrfD